MTAATEYTTTDRHTADLSRIARGGSANLIGAATGALLTLVVTWLITNGAEQSVAGSLFAATSVFLIAGAVAEHGSDVSLAKFLPPLVDRHNLADRRLGDAVAVTRIALAITAVAGLAAGGLLAALRGPVARLVAGPGTHPDLKLGILVLAAGIPVAAVMNAALSATRGLGTVRPSVVTDKVGRGILQVVAITAAVLAGAGMAGLTVAWALPYAAGCAAAIAWLAVLLRRAGGHRSPGRARRAELIREYASYTWPRAVARVAQSVLQRADIVLVAALRSPAEAAVYTVATRFLVIGQLGTQAIQQVVAPQISGLLAADDRTRAKRVFQIATAWNMALNWPLFLTFLGTAPLLLGLFGGPGFRSGDRVVVILSVAALAAAAGGSVDILLLMAGRSGLSLVNSLVALAVNLTVNLLLIPPYGITGAAVAWAAAIAVRNLLGMIQVRRSVGWLPFSRAAAVITVLAGLSFAVPSLALRAAGDPSPGIATAVVAAAVAVYVALLWRFRVVLGLDAFTSLLPRRAGRLTAAPGGTDGAA